MLRLATKIKINKYVFTACHSINVRKDYTSFTNTAEIMLPNVIYKKQDTPVGQSESDVEALIKKGDPVKIYAGYDKSFDELSLLFTGFVSQITTDRFVQVKCEDYSYVLKQINITSKLLRDATLKELIDHALGDVEIDINYVIPSNTVIGDFKIENTSYYNVVQVLETLKENLGIVSYFEGTTLTIGKFVDVNADQHNLLFQNNIIEDNLEFRKEDDINLVIKGISILEDDSKIERYAYKELGEVKVSEEAVQGEQITLTFYNHTLDMLEDNLTDNFSKYVYTGYSGSFTTFLEPKIEPADKVYLRDLKFTDRDGKYKTRAIETNIDMNGGRQIVHLDYKVA